MTECNNTPNNSFNLNAFICDRCGRHNGLSRPSSASSHSRESESELVSTSVSLQRRGLESLSSKLFSQSSRSSNRSSSPRDSSRYFSFRFMSVTSSLVSSNAKPEQILSNEPSLKYKILIELFSNDCSVLFLV